MANDVTPLRCSILRGGTSRAVFFRREDLPGDRAAIEAILLDVFGSPDIRQIDGLGGATSQTSKAAIIGPPSRTDADVDYTFAQVSVTDALVDWGGNCGNISSAVGPYAIDAGLVAATEPITVVRIHNTNTAKVILAHVPVVGGRAAVDGDYAIPGVPGTAARILLEFADPAGSISGHLLPTGRPIDTIDLPDGRTIEASIVDAANPVVFLRASDLGLTGTELPAAIEANRAATDTLEAARAVVAEWLGLVPDRRDALKRTPGLPKVGYVAPPADYVTTTGERVPASSFDLCGRLMSMQTAHRTYMTTGAIATAAAAFIPGTIVAKVVRPLASRPLAESIRIGHPYGVMEGVVRLGSADTAGTGGAGDAVAPALPTAQDPVAIAGVAVGRTARHILDGTVWVRSRVLPGS